MGEFCEKAKGLRGSEKRKYNCAQAVLLSFASETGLDEETSRKIASGFGSGMKVGNVCGAVTGGIMVLGLLGLDTSANTSALFRFVKAHHEGQVNCRDLLALNAKSGMDQNRHCDNMVFEVVGFIEDLLQKQKSCEMEG